MIMEELRESPFFKDLTKTFGQIKQTRAEGLAEDLHLAYTRRIEDLIRDFRALSRKREDMMLDMLPTNSFSNKVANEDWDPAAFEKQEEEIGLKKRDIRVRLRIVLDAYEANFGTYRDADSVRRILPDYGIADGNVITTED